MCGLNPTPVAKLLVFEAICTGASLRRLRLHLTSSHLLFWADVFLRTTGEMP